MTIRHFLIAAMMACCLAPAMAHAQAGVGIGYYVNNTWVPVDAAHPLPMGGSGTAALGKVEDTPSADGDTGIFVLCVRNDSLTALVSANGDYAGCQTDNIGRLWAHGQMEGLAGHSVATSGNPLQDGCSVQTAVDTTLVAGDISHETCTTGGYFIAHLFAPPELGWSYVAPTGGITTTASTPMKAAAAAGVRNYVTGCDLANSSATPTEVAILDGATVIWRTWFAGSSSNNDITFATPLKSTAATAINIQTSAAAALLASCQGFIAP